MYEWRHYCAGTSSSTSHWWDFAHAELVVLGIRKGWSDLDFGTIMKGTIQIQMVILPTMVSTDASPTSADGTDYISTGGRNATCGRFKVTGHPNGYFMVTINSAAFSATNKTETAVPATGA
jgi:hypothetical protein